MRGGIVTDNTIHDGCWAGTPGQVWTSHSYYAIQELHTFLFPISLSHEFHSKCHTGHFCTEMTTEVHRTA